MWPVLILNVCHSSSYLDFKYDSLFATIWAVVKYSILVHQGQATKAINALSSKCQTIQLSVP